MNSQHKTEPVILPYDYAKLLKDSNSPLYKQLFNDNWFGAELRLSLDIERLIQLMEKIIREEAEELADEEKLRAALAKAAQIRQQNDVPPVNSSLYRIALRFDYAILLSTSQVHMTIAQLNTHFQSVIYSLQSQVIQQLGLPPSALQALTPPAKTAQFLNVIDPNGNLSLGQAKALIKHRNISEATYRTPIKLLPVLFPNKDIYTPADTKKADAILRSIIDRGGYEILMKCLEENADLSVEKIYEARAENVKDALLDVAQAFGSGQADPKQMEAIDGLMDKIQAAVGSKNVNVAVIVPQELLPKVSEYPGYFAQNPMKTKLTPEASSKLKRIMSEKSEDEERKTPFAAPSA